MMPNLTPEQKEHLKISRKANMRIEETWMLFTMYLGQDKRPGEALSLARAAVDVWAEFMDDATIEPPEIEPPDFLQQMGMAADIMAQKLNERQPGAIALRVGKDGTLHGIEAVEFPAALPESTDPQGQDGPKE